MAIGLFLNKTLDTICIHWILGGVILEIDIQMILKKMYLMTLNVLRLSNWYQPVISISLLCTMHAIGANYTTCFLTAPSMTYFLVFQVTRSLRLMVRTYEGRV